MSSTSEWFHSHQNSATATSSLGHVAPPYATALRPDLFFDGLASDSTAVTTSTEPPQAGPGQSGRVTKPARRNTRASKRTPTTLITADPANFRAMVQKFTGGPSNSFSAIPNTGSQGFGGGPGLEYGLQFPVGYANSSNSSNLGNTEMFMHGNMMDYNNINNVIGGSSSSENRSNNNSFQF